MSATKTDGGPAFPHVAEGGIDSGLHPNVEFGMSLRDYFAAAVAQGLSVGCAGMLGKDFSAYAKGPCNAVIAERAYSVADAMLAARAAQGGKE